MDMQTQSSEIQEMDRLRTYKILKTNFGCERYLFSIKNKLCRTAMPNFRGCLLRIKCNEGRNNRTPLNERFCLLCYQDVDTEYHFLLVCRALSHIRLKYISPIWFTYPSVDKYVQLYTSKSTNIINVMARYIVAAITFRTEFVKKYECLN